MSIDPQQSRLFVRLRRRASFVLFAILLAFPTLVLADTCYGINPAGSISGFSGFWDFMMT